MSGRSTANAFTHPPTASEIAGLGRKKLLLAGVLTELIIQHNGLSGADRGYDVQVVVDACGALSSRMEDAALGRLVQAGVAITSSASIAAQLMGDLAQSPKAAEALKLCLRSRLPPRPKTIRRLNWIGSLQGATTKTSHDAQGPAA